MKHTTSYLCLIIIAFLLGSCETTGAQPASIVSETLPTAPPATQPVITSTQNLPTLPPATETTAPTLTHTPTLVPTDTPLPTHTPTITPTPGPFSFIDDFTLDSGGWADCELCSWTDGALIMGPFEPSSNFHKNYCTGCGERSFYKLSVEATFIDGQVDRFFGVFFGDAYGKQYYLGISPWQLYIIGQHTDEDDSWEILDAAWSGAVNPSYATNTFEVTVKPAYKKNTADYLFSLNGSIIYIIYGTSVVPSKAGLAMDWHAVTVSYDNWEYVEIEP